MSETQPALANLPPLPAWAVWLGLGLAGLGGGTGTLTTALSMLSADPDVSEDVRQLRKDVNATSKTVHQLNEALNQHVSADATRDVAVADHERRINALELNQDAVRQRLDQIRVNQLVICRTLKAPCGD